MNAWDSTSDDLEKQFDLYMTESPDFFLEWYTDIFYFVNFKMIGENFI